MPAFPDRRIASLLPLAAAVSLLLGGLLAGNAHAQIAPKPSFLIRVNLPLQSHETEQVKLILDKLLEKVDRDGPRPTFFLEFKPSDPVSAGAGSNFAAAHELARKISSSEMTRVQTVAFVPESIRGHAVLPILACERIAMARSAEIGDAGVDESHVDASILSVYEHVAGRRKTVPSAVAKGMVDRRLTVYWIKQPEAQYVLEKDLQELKDKGLATDITTLKKEGEPLRLTGKEMRETHGFVSDLADNISELEARFDLPSGSLEIDPTLGETPRPVLVNLSGSTKGIGWIARSIQDEISTRKVNLVILRIDSPGGNLGDSVALAKFLADLPDSEVRTVAFISEGARSDAAIIAMACDHVVMTPGATLGGPGASSVDETTREMDLRAVRAVMEKNSRRWSIPQAMIDPGVAVFSYRNSDSGHTEYFSEAEAAAQRDPKVWVKGEPIGRPGEQLSVVGDRARDWRVAKYVVENFEQLKALYNLKEDPPVVQPNWAHRLVEGLADPRFAFILVFVGGAALIVEMKTPGIGIGAFTAGVCFLLFFWGQILRGNADYLEVMLFIAGLLCLALEMFVMPGTMIFGFGGACLIIASLILATQTFVIPRNSYELAQVPVSLFTVIAAGTGVLVSFYVMGKLLPHTPMLSSLVLKPPGEEQARRESLVAYDDLLGQTGVTTSLLSPSGEARFGSRIVDVISRGELIHKGSSVTVVEVLGNRVIVEKTAEVERKI